MGELMVFVARSGDGEDDALVCPLHENRYLPLKNISAHWGLDPMTMLIGRFILAADANGNSNIGADTIRDYSSSQGLGDGLTSSTPFIITGKPASTTSTSTYTTSSTSTTSSAMSTSSSTTEKKKFREFSLLADKVYLAALPVNELPRLIKNMMELRPLVALLVNEQEAARTRDLFEGDSAPHRYLKDINKPKSLVATFVGTVHVVPKSLDPDTFIASDDHPAGIVTLVRPEGWCVTASACLKGFTDDDFKILVNFPRLTGSTVYEYRIASTSGLVVLLVTVERQRFDECMDSSLERYGGDYMFDGLRSLNVVECVEVESGVILPTAEVDGNSVVGGPVFNCTGQLKGVVTDASMFLRKGGESSSTRKCVSDLDLDSHEDWKLVKMRKEYQDALGGEESEEHKQWTKVREIGRVVQVERALFQTLYMDWCEQNPLTKFVDKVVAMVSQPGFNLYANRRGYFVSPRSKRVEYRGLSDEDIHQLAEKQKALRDVKTGRKKPRIENP